VYSGLHAAVSLYITIFRFFLVTSASSLFTATCETLGPPDLFLLLISSVQNVDIFSKLTAYLEQILFEFVALSNPLINALQCLRFLSSTSFLLLLPSVLFVSFVLCSILCICVLVVTTELTIVLWSWKLNKDLMNYYYYYYYYYYYW
jgi:hypothetical protein